MKQLNQIVNLALQYVGYPSIKYVSPNKGVGPDYFDCSGFVQWILSESNIIIPKIPNTDRLIRHTNEFFDYFGINIHEEVRMPGDLIFFSKDGIRPSHIGLYIGKNKIIHSPGLDNKIVEVCSLDDFLDKNPLIFSKNGHPQLYVKNPIGYKRISTQNKNRYQKILK